MHDRRSFLRGLASLPLIGGGVTLIGQPTAAAVPITDALHERYFTFLAHEHRAAMKEHGYRTALVHARRRLGGHVADCEAWARSEGERAHYFDWMPEASDVEAVVASAPPSTRAAVILSAAGVPLAGLGA